MEPSIAVNLLPAIVKERVLTRFPMDPPTPVNGTMDAITESVNAFGTMVASTRENGEMVRHTGMVSKSEPTGRYGMKEHGPLMCRFEKDDFGGVLVCL
jgi:hypothetical protein